MAQPYDPRNPAHIATGGEDTFDRLRTGRRQDNDGIPLQTYSDRSPVGPPQRDPQGRYWQETTYNPSSMASNVTPGGDNFGPAAGGGMAGIAMTVAEANARESGLEAERGIPEYNRQHPHDYSYNHGGAYQAYDPQNQSYHDNQMTPGYDSAHVDPFNQPGYDPSPSPYRRDPFRDQDSNHSQPSLLSPAAAAHPGARSPGMYMDETYGQDSYGQLSTHRHPGLGTLDPNSIEDDGDDGLEYTNHSRHSMLSLGHHSDRAGTPALAAGAVGAAGVAGAVALAGGASGGLSGRNGSAGANYGPVEPGAAGYDHYALDREAEKSEWMDKQKKGTNKWRWIIGGILVLIVLGGVGGGLAYYFVNKKNTASTSPTAAADSAANGDLSASSPEIQALMGNKALHKVFPGIDYTPMNTQYPDCLTNPPDQNNVTRDMAVLSQLTNVVRLYGTDCNQTEMVLHSINQLNLQNSVKVWLGVWQSTNDTTNARQLSQMYDVLKTYGTAQLKGAIVGNEVLFRKDMTETQLAALLTEVKSNFTALGYNIPVATSDLGDNWTAALAQVTDYVMANVHPFFSGIDEDHAAGWTWDFWQNNNWALKPDLAKNLISETGWPSQGGTDCGGATSCTGGSVAGITGMNTFMSDWVCQALANGTQYFMFEAFDEPWKIIYDSGNQNWEDHWGLMDTSRNLKSGLTIPDCGGKTVGAA